MASIPEREHNLSVVVNRILPQVDRLFVALNDYDHIPWWLDNDKIEVFSLDNSLGDAAKFYNIENVFGYYLALDDDLAVPQGYVKKMIEGVDKYEGLVSLHGRKYLSPNFKNWAGNYNCLRTVSDDVRVNLIGSGCCAFHTKSIELKLSDFKTPNMADLYLSRVAALQNKPMVVLKHEQGYLRYLKPEGKTIWQETKDYTPHNEILRSYIK